MADLTSQQTASIIENTVKSIMTNIVIPDLRLRAEEVILANLPRALEYVFEAQIKEEIHKMVRSEIMSKIKISVTIEDR